VAAGNVAHIFAVITGLFSVALRCAWGKGSEWCVNAGGKETLSVKTQRMFPRAVQCSGTTIKGNARLPG